MENNEELVLFIALLIASNGYAWYRYKQEKGKREKVIHENTRLLADNAKMEADDLKFQLQPHTINNILANLKVLSNKLNRGMEALSVILEYVLYSGKHHMVSIEEELNYLKHYLTLNNLFLSQIDAIKVDSSGINIQALPYRTKSVPHLITGYFLENAFKHGDIQHPEFLQVKLILDEKKFEITVLNKIKQNLSGKSGGVGLANMRKRLDLLLPGKHEISINSTGNEYRAFLKIKF